MSRRLQEIARDLCAGLVSGVFLRCCPALVNVCYDSLPHAWLNFLVGHGFFGRPACAFPWRITLTNGKHLRLDVDPAADVFSTAYAFDYKRHDVGLRRVQEFLIDRMGPSSLYLDIGANVGVSSIYALSCGRSCWLFEPNTALRPFVDKLFAANGYNTARLEDVALSDVAGEAEFYVSRSSFLSSFDQVHAAFEGEVIRVKVLRRTLDSYLPELTAAAREIVVKIDVEGHEMAVLRGAVETLRRYRPPVMLELRSDIATRTAAFDFMSALGYACHGIVNRPCMTLKPLSSPAEAVAFCDINFLFVSKDTALPLR